MPFEIAVLVSIGRHPVSGRARRAHTDAQALELGLRVAAATGARLRVWHAGSEPDESALRDYLGMGADALHVLALPAAADPVPALADRLRAVHSALILTGTQAEAGASSGCLPYALAAALDYAIVPGAAALTVLGATAEVQQALPQGRRRALRVGLPVIVTAARAAPPARQVAYARARRGRLIVEQRPVHTVPSPDHGEARPARARPPRSRFAKDATAAERLAALTSGASGARQAHTARVVHPASPAEAAREIHAFLVDRNLIEPAPRAGLAGRRKRSET
jgi:electron transfer flavoprotein beta subunit